MTTPLAIRSIVIDFDGTICASDVSDEVLVAFAGAPARELDLEYERGAIGSRENLLRTAKLVRATEAEVMNWALSRFRVEPTFPPFVEWCRAVGVEVIVVSDGIGIHIDPMLDAAGIEGLPVISNRLLLDGSAGSFEFVAGHPQCRECGTCKMLAVTSARERGPLATSGTGTATGTAPCIRTWSSPRARWPDLCRADGIAFVPWTTFDDVRVVLEQASLHEPVNPARCPGWRT